MKPFRSSVMAGEGILSPVLCLICLISILAFYPPAAHAAGEAKTPPEQDWSYEGPFGTYDRAALQRGFQVYKQVCASCHAMEHLHYRNLAEIGYSDEEVKAIASQYLITDGPDETGEMYERPGRPSDQFKSPFANRQQAMAVNNGAYPPDQSLIVKARPGGADYIYALLTGYTDPPSDIELRDGLYYNPYYPGYKIAMAPPLIEGLVEYQDGTEATPEQMAKDVTTFLAWSSAPYMEDRKKAGIQIILFLFVFGGLMYVVKKKMWKQIY